MLCSALAQQRHKIIHNRVAFAGEESVSGSPAAAAAGANQENPRMRIYIIGNDGITLCREAPDTVNDGEIVIASNEELHAARSVASGCWHCGMLCPVSKGAEGSATARR